MNPKFSGHRAGFVSAFSRAAALALLCAVPSWAAVKFDQPFSPQLGLTAPVEQPWRQEICLNGTWQFQPMPLPQNYDVANGTPLLPAPKDDAWSSTPIRIPSPWNINGSFSQGRYAARTFPSYPREWETARMGWLKRTFTIPADWKDKRLILHFEAVCGFAQVVVNGREVVQHFDNSLPFETDITDFVERDGDNTLLVGVRQASLFDVPGMFGRHTYPAGSPWTLHMIGIWQDVFLRALPPVRVDDIAVRSLVDQGVLEMLITVRNNTPHPQAFRIGGKVQPWINESGTDVISAPAPKGSLGEAVASIDSVEGTVGPRMTTTLTLRRPIKNELKFWTPESPNLYGLVLDLQQDGKTADRFYQRFGWRQFGIKGRDATLNGKVYQFRGDSGHLLGVSYMTSRYAWSWYKAIKDVNGNAIRLHAIVRPRFYLELADEMGIAILDESDIWASSVEVNHAAPETYQRFGEHIDGLVLRDRNHASIFGWSIANEIQSALWWKGIPRGYWPGIVDKVVALADRVRALDPTRPWISSDGDGDFHGKLPVFIYHYNAPEDWNRQAPKDRPFGLGEAGSMIWTSPVVFSVYNGERSYESIEGMQEGIAIESYRYLVEQRKMAAFCSIFTVASTCFKPLLLGVANPKAMPTPEDGVVFGSFLEGQPGMQPERMPAWGTNFNPGYDPSQPLYQTTAVFEAVKAAYAPEGPQPCPWDHVGTSVALPPPPTATIKEVAFIGDENGALKHALESSGVPAAASNTVSAMLVVDGATLTKEQLPAVRARMDETLKQRGTVFVWAAPEHLDELNALLPAKISLTKRSEVALYADRKAPETASLSLADLYFGDQADTAILQQGIEGPLVQQSRVLMRGNTFGRNWFMPESESKAPALIATDVQGGRLLVTSLSPDVRSERRLKLMRSIYANLGVALGEPSEKHNTGFDGVGFLNQAMQIGPFQGALYPKILDLDFLGNEAQADPKPGEQVKDRTWTKKASLGSGLFMFFDVGNPAGEDNRARGQNGVLKPEALDANDYLEDTDRLSGTLPGTNSVVYLSFWLHSPRDAGGAKSTPLDLLLRSDDGTKVWINSQPIFQDYETYGPGITDPKKVPVALNAGWNRVLVKVGQLAGLWLFSAKFESPDSDLVSQLRASATRPSQL